MPELQTTLALHHAWWTAVTELATKQAQECKCWELLGGCEVCLPLGTAVIDAESALREAGEWNPPFLPMAPE